MLEKFGLTKLPDGKFTINTREAIDGVTEELGLFFKYKPHYALIQFTSPGSEAAAVRNILGQRDVDKTAINESVERITAGKEMGGATLYTGDLDLPLTPKPAFMVFLSTATATADFPFTLGEEITHGEHMANVIDEQNISNSEYRQRFHELTEEVLGYLGRKRIFQVAGVSHYYPLNVSLDRNHTENEWAHFLAYTTVDDLERKEEDIPAANLFHAPNETKFWQILLEAIKEPIEFNFNFPPDLNFKGLIKPLRNLVREAKANRILKLRFNASKT